MRVHFGVAAAAVLMASGCGGDTTGPPEPTPGVLTASLTAPAGAATGALVMTVSGPGEITNVTGSAAGHQVYSRPSGSGVRVAVFGTIAPGALVRFHVPDTREVDEYSVALTEAAGTDNAVKPLSGYTVTVSD